jgi:hypothetical protein
MKNEQKYAKTNDELPGAAASVHIIEEDIVRQILHAKSLKDMTIEQKKKEAGKPIYLVRYE